MYYNVYNNNRRSYVMLLTTMIIRTLLCKPQEIDAGEFKARDFDKDLIAKHLSEAVQIPTVSMVGEFEGQDKPFHDYHAWLEKTYPLIHKTAEKPSSTITVWFIASKVKIRRLPPARSLHIRTSSPLRKKAGITSRSAALSTAVSSGDAARRI